MLWYKYIHLYNHKSQGTILPFILFSTVITLIYLFTVCTFVLIDNIIRYGCTDVFSLLPFVCDLFSASEDSR